MSQWAEIPRCFCINCWVVGSNNWIVCWQGWFCGFVLMSYGGFSSNFNVNVFMMLFNCFDDTSKSDILNEQSLTNSLLKLMCVYIIKHNEQFSTQNWTFFTFINKQITILILLGHVLCLHSNLFSKILPIMLCVFFLWDLIKIILTICEYASTIEFMLCHEIFHNYLVMRFFRDRKKLISWLKILFTEFL